MRDPLAAFLGFDPEPARPLPPDDPPPLVERQVSASAGADEARMCGAARSIMEARGLDAVIAALERARKQVIRDARDLGKSGNWVG